MRLIPRDYQQEGHEATWNYLHQHPDKNPLIVEPTGTGKSLQMAMLIWHLKTAYPHVRILSVAHKQELIDSNHKTLMAVWPAAPAGVYSAGLGIKEHRLDITFAGIDSVAKKAALFKRIDFVIIDEAHTVGEKDTGKYRRFLDALRGANPALVVVGYTATAFRTKSGLLVDGPLFDEVCFDLSRGDQFTRMIDDGYLIRPVPKDPGIQLDSSNVAIRAGEYDDKQASAALRDQNILEQAVDMTIRAGTEQGRRAWLHFCQSVEDADTVAEMFTHKGYPHEAVHSKRTDRADVLAAFRKGELIGVANKDILTTGYNQQNIDLITALRLTRSPGLWVQMVGRGTRPVYAPGFDITSKVGRLQAIAASPKHTCLVLDFVGNTERLGPINYPNIPNRRGKGGGSRIMARKCPLCDTYNHIAATVCEDCGHVFPVAQKLKSDASAAELVRTLNLAPPAPPPPRELTVEPVHAMTCTLKEPRVEGKLPSMQVSYRSGFQVFREWVCLEHPRNSFPHRKAREWWEAHAGKGSGLPQDVASALARVGELRAPKFIEVEVSGKFPEVKRHDFIGTKFQLPPELGGPALADPGPDPAQAFTNLPQQEDPNDPFV